ncbi:MAG: nitrilase-related carbon-nitrogen hydrolase [Hyphomonadaceae bacterium]|nr:nitrilase-related carbon-nitrogen hydrolase [Hyphomonadaceae bacterium]
MTRRDILLATAGLAMTDAAAQTAQPRFSALALQTRCDAVNQDQSVEAARRRMAATIARISAQIGAAKGFLAGFNGAPLRLVVLPEYWMTGFPMGEARAVWQDKAAIDVGGAEDEAIAAMAQRHSVFLCSNHYENDRHFPDLYFQANVVYAPDGSTVLRYRRMISLYAPTPYDVWDRYLDAYGADAVFPVARTDIGVLGTIASEEILYPEIARMTALKGAEILLHPTSEVGSPSLTPKHVSKLARASENMAYVVSANSAGIDGTSVPAQSTDAMSVVVDWYGRIVAEAGPGETIVANAILDMDGLRGSRRRTGMTNLLSRLPMSAFAPAYTQERVIPNGMADGRILERAQVIERQRAVIERLARDGAIR